MSKWGFLRESEELAKKAGIDKETGLPRTGLETYLRKIFPEVNDWVHDKQIPGCVRKLRPDYRSETLKMIIDFDGIPHYQQPDVILKDKEKSEFYASLGYKVIRIPYFIQLTSRSIKDFFGVEMSEEMFPENVPSLGINNKNTPAFLCFLGIQRMAEDFKKFPSQYKTNIEFLEKQNNEVLTGVEMLKKFITL